MRYIYERADENDVYELLALGEEALEVYREKKGNSEKEEMKVGELIFSSSMGLKEYAEQAIERYIKKGGKLVKEMPSNSRQLNLEGEEVEIDNKGLTEGQIEQAIRVVYKEDNKKMLNYLEKNHPDYCTDGDFDSSHWTFL